MIAAGQAGVSCVFARRDENMTITVMLVEDDPAFLNRFRAIVDADHELELFAAAGDCASARQALAKAAPDVLLIDLGLPDGSGIDIIRETAANHPGTDIMVVSVFADEAHVLQAIESGATGYILKDSIPGEFVGLIKQLRAGGSPISPVIARQLIKRFKPAAIPGKAEAEDARLSPRESEVLSLIARGFSFNEIARLLAISQHTVTAHVKMIYKKLAVHSRGEAVYEAGKLGLV
jgi:DNA-binding NarL/FixJ family response regulator